MSTVRPQEPGTTSSHTALARGTSQAHRYRQIGRHIQMYTLHRNTCGYKHIYRHILKQILKQTHLPAHTITQTVTHGDIDTIMEIHRERYI